MRSGGGDCEALGVRRLTGCAAKRRQRVRDFGDRRADVGVRLEDRREELCLDATRQLLALDAAQDAVDRRDLLVRRRSRIISSSSTPSENGGVPPNRCSITSWRGRRAPGDRPRPMVVRSAWPELGAVPGDAWVAPYVAGARRVPQQIGVVGRLPDQDQMRRGHELGDEAAAGGGARKRIGADAKPAVVVAVSSSSQSSSTSKTTVDCCSNTICPRPSRTR